MIDNKTKSELIKLTNEKVNNNFIIMFKHGIETQIAKVSTFEQNYIHVCHTRFAAVDWRNVKKLITKEEYPEYFL